MRLHPSKKNIDLHLHIPDKDAECPILQESISSAVFESFPKPFDRAHPEHKAMTLGCSHTFHAMALVYHWSRNKNVLCPICRAGPRGQRLTMTTLPEDWRYSMASRVRKETRRDQEETERENFRMAAALARPFTHHAPVSPVVSFVIKIEIQAQTMGGPIMTWRLNTFFTPRGGAIIFQVPSLDLQGIPPFTLGAMIRLIPFAYSAHTINMLRPSEWFTPDGALVREGGFSIEYDADGRFRVIQLTLHEDEFTTLVVDAYIAASGGVHV